MTLGRRLLSNKNVQYDHQDGKRFDDLCVDQTCAAGNPFGISLGPVKRLRGDVEGIHSARIQARDIIGVFLNLATQDLLRVCPGHIVTVTFLVLSRMIPRQFDVIRSRGRRAQIDHAERSWLCERREAGDINPNLQFI